MPVYKTKFSIEGISVIWARSWPLFSDIILYNGIDAYDNLPDKTFAGYQFFSENCKEREYVVFHDDDVFIAVNELKGQMKKVSPGTLINLSL